MKKQNKKIEYCVVAVAVFSFLFGIFAIQLSDFAVDKFIYKDKLVGLEYSENCSDGNVFEVSYCLNQKLIKFYKYNMSNVEKEISFEQLKTEGGVCEHYANWYMQNLDGKGFYVEQIILPINKEIDHTFVIVGSSDGWCSLDQEQIDCIKYKSFNKTEELKGGKNGTN